MSEKEVKIMQTFAEVIPTLSDEEKAYLLGFGEGMAAAIKPKPEEKE